VIGTSSNFLSRVFIRVLRWKMHDMNDVIPMWLMRAAFWCTLLIIAANPPCVLAQSRQTDAGVGNARWAFLSGPKEETQQPADETPSSMQQEDNKNFDGAWTFTIAGCRYTGSLPARIVGGKVIIRGGSGQVDPDGTLHSVGAGNDIAVGQLSGNTGSGTFYRSDGCVGSWIAIKRGASGGGQMGKSN
jgi:hypothetical protein